MVIIFFFVFLKRPKGCNDGQVRVPILTDQFLNHAGQELCKTVSVPILTDQFLNHAEQELCKTVFDSNAVQCMNNFATAMYELKIFV